jgi:Zn finger protein HypA/HybF involved in hydrogenase expression
MFNLRWPQGITTDSTLPGLRPAAGALEELVAANGHVVVEEPTSIHDLDKEPIVERAIATEDDLVDDCPICTEMRDRIRNGEEIEIVKVRWAKR